MKFSKSKKQKMRRIRAKRIHKHYGSDAIGCTVDWKKGFVAKDQITIGDVIYLLAKNELAEYAIYRLVDVHKYARIGSKRIWQLRDEFECRENWRNETNVYICNDGINGVSIRVYS